MVDMILVVDIINIVIFTPFLNTFANVTQSNQVSWIFNFLFRSEER